MSNLIKRQFPAKALLNGLRAIGYSFSTAVADIFDNSISAGASEIRVYSDPLANEPFFCILDNGHGMTLAELDNAMLPGSNRTGIPDSELELGRFGLGLKSASLSQCREFIVASKRNDEINAMAFDLDVIEEANDLYLKRLTQEELDGLPYINELKNYGSGTLVIWIKFDRIQGLAKNFENSFRSLVAESKKHIELVFHRFYNSVSIYYHQKRIERRDPFLKDSIGRQQTGRRIPITIDNSNISVIPYTLPYANTLTSAEKALLGNPKSIYDEQGFYLYRNKRLIAWGSWMHMGIRSELNKLARIQVDIPSTLDSIWMLDVKKSSAKIPDKIKDQIKIAVEESIVRSKRTTRFPGIKEQSYEHKIWNRIDEHEGHIRYQINRDAPAIVSLVNALGNEEKQLLEIVFSQIECYLPKGSILNDGMDALKIVNTGSDAEEEHLICEIEAILNICEPSIREEMFNRIFLAENYQCLYKKKADIHRRLFING